MTDVIFDVTIVGGGPVGLFGAYYAGLRQMKTKILDSLDGLGGQLTTLYPEKHIFDVAGFPRILAKDLVANLVEQAMASRPSVCLGETVGTIERDEARGCYVIGTDKARHATRTVILCAGAGAFSPKKLPVPGAEALEGRGVHYAVRSKAAFAGHRLLIIGGGDSAVDWALNLRDTAGAITLIHRRNQFRAHEDSVRQLLASEARVLTFWELKAIHAPEGRLTAAVIVHNQTGEERTMAIDSILVQVGFVSSLGAIKHWPVKTIGSGIAVDSHMETGLPGVFAAGDVAAFEGKLKLIATGFGEVAVAVNYAKHRIDPAAKVFPGHSSEMVAQAPPVVVPAG